MLTRKKMIYAANVADTDLAEGNDPSERLREHAASEGAATVLVSAQAEAELADLDDADMSDFLESLGAMINDRVLRSVVREAYDTLNLRT